MKKFFFKSMDVIWVFICIFSGILFEYVVLGMHIVIVPCADIRGLSLTLIGIITSLISIVFSIIAFLSGSIDRKFLGVHVVDFYLNRQPFHITYKELFFSSFFCSIFSIWFYNLEYYNVVFGFLYASFFIVIKAATNVFKIFNNPLYIEDEIKRNVKLHIENIGLYEELNAFFDIFICDWNERLELQSEQEFDCYKNIYELINDRMMDLYFEKSFDDIETKGSSLVQNMLSSGKMITRNKAFDIIICTYSSILKKVNSQSIKIEYVRSKKLRFNLLSNINQCLWDIHFFDPLNFLIRSNMFMLIYEVLKLEITLNDNCEDFSDFWNNLYCNTSSIRGLTQFIVFSLINNKDEYKKDSLMTKLLSKHIFLMSINDNQDQFILGGEMIFHLDICIRLLENGKIRDLKNYFYLGYVADKLEYMDNLFDVLFILSFHGYLYYLAEKEVESFIDEELKNCALELWNDQKIQREFYGALINSRHLLYQYKKDKRNKEIHNFAKLLSWYELKGHTNCKEIKMSNYMDEFYVFTILLIHIEGAELQDEWKECVDLDLISSNFINMTYMKEQFVKFCNIVCQRSEYEYNNELFKKVYDVFIKEIRGLIE